MIRWWFVCFSLSVFIFCSWSLSFDCFVVDAFLVLLPAMEHNNQEDINALTKQLSNTRKINEATQRNITNSTTKTRRSNNEKQKQTDQDNQQKTKTNERSVQRQTNQQYDKKHRTNLGKNGWIFIALWAPLCIKFGIHFAWFCRCGVHFRWILGPLNGQERRFRPFCRFGVHLGWITPHGTGPAAP